MQHPVLYGSHRLHRQLFLHFGTGVKAVALGSFLAYGPCIPTLKPYHPVSPSWDCHQAVSSR